ncbi:MAG TPA: enoyl-CoA hydratase/isomerase family protein [Chloroflexota bacterium]|nr:enoyl-CoA hydratase/isomerase family protein [Chloroflexota bacterium]
MLVLTEKRDLIAKITLNRPEKLNALSRELIAELLEAFESLREDDEVRAVVLTGSGRAFSSGADLGGQRGEHGRTIEEWEARMLENMTRQFFVRDFPKPVIAAVDGYCLGRGCELALWCDVVIASETAWFGEPEIRHGSMVASMIPWLTNPQQAKLLILTGDTISAAEAHSIGLVAKVVAPDRLQAEAERIAGRMAKVPAFAVRYNKQLINAMYDAMGFRQAMDYGHKIETLCHSRIPEAANVEGVNLEQRRREAGVKAFLAARDDPFRA